MDELLPVVNDKDEQVGTATFSQVHEKGLLHREAYLYITSNGRVLLQRRADNDKWDTTSAGHCTPGEAYVDAAIREYKEELGIVIPKEQVQEIAYLRMEGVKPNKKNMRFMRVCSH